MTKVAPRSRKSTRNNYASKAATVISKGSRRKAQNAQTPKSANDRYRDLKRKAEESGFVVHHAKFCNNRPGTVPTEHQARFEHIQTLGGFVYDTYGLQPSPETIDKPWQLVNKGKASRLSRLAIKCKEERQNEAGWRAIVEFRLFERFEIEVAW